MLGGKAGAKVKPISNGIRMDTSVYGSVIPVVFGRTRIPGKMIFAGNYRTHKSSTKKFGGKKGQKQTSYSGNFDWLLCYAPVVAVGDVWRNKDNFWPVGIGFQTFDTQTATISNNPGPVLGIISVLATVDISVTFNDFGAPGPVVVSEQEQIPLYPSGQLFFSVNGNIAPGGFDWQTWNTTTVTVYNVGPTTNDITALQVTVDSGHPMTVFYFFQIGSKSPLANAGLEFEPILGSGGEFSYPGGSTFHVEYPEFAGIAGTNVDMGTGNTAPNDNFEVISLYALSHNGDANVADVMLDVILAGNPVQINGATSGFNWNHGLGFNIGIDASGQPTKPNCLADPPVPVT